MVQILLNQIKKRLSNAVNRRGHFEWGLTSCLGGFKAVTTNGGGKDGQKTGSRKLGV